MAVLVSLLLNNVDRAIAPGGVMNILDWHGSYYNYNFADLDVIKNATNEQQAFFDLRPMLKYTNADVFLYYAIYSKSDKEIVESIKDFTNDKYHIVLFNTNKHGSYCLPFEYKYLLTIPANKMIEDSKLSDTTLSPTKYSIIIEGLLLYILNSIQRMIRRIKRKVLH